MMPQISRVDIYVVLIGPHQEDLPLVYKCGVFRPRLLQVGKGIKMRIQAYLLIKPAISTTLTMM